MPVILSIATGGALGAVLRHYLNIGLTALLPGSSFPWGIFTANILGSFCMGVLIGVFAHIWEPPQATKAFLTVGLLGAFTTFSTFSLDTVTLLERGAWLSAGLYMAGSVILAVSALYSGLFVIRTFSL